MAMLYLDEAEKNYKSEKINIEIVILKSETTIRLDKWKKRGIGISIYNNKLGLEFCSEKPYTNIKKAEKDYDKLVKEIKKGNCVLEIYDNKYELKIKK